MRRAAVLVCMLWCSTATPPVAADPAFKDMWCPSAAAAVAGYTAAGHTNDPLKIAAAAAAAADAYRACATNALATAPNTYEPAVNYDRVRIAQFTFSQGRALAVAGKTDDAVPVLRDARKIADEVATWEPNAQSYVSSNGLGGSSAQHNASHQGSAYQENALEVRDAADKVLAQLGASPPAPSPSPSP